MKYKREMLGLESSSRRSFRRGYPYVRELAISYRRQRQIAGIGVTPLLHGVGRRDGSSKG